MSREWLDKLVKDATQDATQDAPDWLNELLESIAGHIETAPPTIGWQTCAPEDEDPWEARIFPGPTEHEGKILYPYSFIDVTAILAEFSSFEIVTWGNEGVSELSIEGVYDGHEVVVAVLSRAPEGVAAMTRILPGEGFAWEDIES